MIDESPLRQLVRGLAGYARALRNLAGNPGLKTVYNNLCDILDTLNEELKDEYEGPIPSDWEKLSAPSQDSSVSKRL
jgi:hypothetical protein